MISLVLLSAVSAGAAAQDNPHRTSPHYGGTDEYFLDTQQWQILDQVQRTLDAFPPAPVNATVKSPADQARKMALFGFDAIIHNTIYDWSDAMQEYLDNGADRIIASLDTPVEDGLRVHLVYNMGFIVQSKSLTVAFDLSSEDGRSINAKKAEELVDRCDMLVISHRHGDHADKPVVERFLSQGKPVIAPNAYWPENGKIMHLRNENKHISGKVKLLSGKKIAYDIFPGHQNETETTWTECNNTVITFPEGYKAAHLGDQAHPEDNVWIKDAHKKVPGIDIMMVTCWMGDLNTIIPGYDPRMIFAGHANERFHGITSRIPFWYAYHQYENFSYPAIIMNWGEIYNYHR